MITLFLFLLVATFAFAAALIWMFLTEILPWLIVIYIGLVVLRVLIATLTKEKDSE